jgi:hypothetical protein
MKRHSVLLLLAGAMLIPAARAGTITFGFRVETSGITAPGWIDFQFNQANAGTSLSATATITNFMAPGFIFADPAQVSAGVTGDLFTIAVVIPNDAAGANFFAQPVSTWGPQFQFDVTLTGDAVGNAAPDGSGFYVFLEDETGAPLPTSLPFSEALNITIDTAGAATAEYNDLASPTPEPGTAWLMVAGFGMVAFAIQRRRTR